MLRIVFFIAAVYIAALAMLDTVAYNGRYSRAVLNAASYQVEKTRVEVLILLDRIGVSSTAIARP